MRVSYISNAYVPLRNIIDFIFIMPPIIVTFRNFYPNTHKQSSLLIQIDEKKSEPLHHYRLYKVRTINIHRLRAVHYSGLLRPIFSRRIDSMECMWYWLACDVLSERDILEIYSIHRKADGGKIAIKDG